MTQIQLAVILNCSKETCKPVLESLLQSKTLYASSQCLSIGFIKNSLVKILNIYKVYVMILIKDRGSYKFLVLAHNNRQNSKPEIIKVLQKILKSQQIPSFLQMQPLIKTEN